MGEYELCVINWRMLLGVVGIIMFNVLAASYPAFALGQVNGWWAIYFVAPLLFPFLAVVATKGRTVTLRFEFTDSTVTMTKVFLFRKTQVERFPLAQMQGLVMKTVPTRMTRKHGLFAVVAGELKETTVYVPTAYELDFFISGVHACMMDLGQRPTVETRATMNRRARRSVLMLGRAALPLASPSSSPAEGMLFIDEAEEAGVTAAALAAAAVAAVEAEDAHLKDVEDEVEEPAPDALRIALPTSIDSRHGLLDDEEEEEQAIKSPFEL
eukprot:PLAT4253.1.p2 GENE.PLAT4253.1~~PLAT4253.1.p2  ORF type:complete len:269 (-),score=97.27 PLAT4253.1:92-898(-)